MTEILRKNQVKMMLKTQNSVSQIKGQVEKPFPRDWVTNMEPDLGGIKVKELCHPVKDIEIFFTFLFFTKHINRTCKNFEIP